MAQLLPLSLLLLFVLAQQLLLLFSLLQLFPLLLLLLLFPPPPSHTLLVPFSIYNKQQTNAATFTLNANECGVAQAKERGRSERERESE